MNTRLVLRVTYFTKFLFLGSLGVFTVKASHPSLEAETKTALSQKAPSKAKGTEQRLDLAEWRASLSDPAAPPVQMPILQAARKGFFIQQELAQWICLVGDTLSNDQIPDKSVYVDHLIETASMYSPSQQRASDRLLWMTYPNVDLICEVAKTYCKLGILLTERTPAHQSLTQNHLVKISTAMHGLKEFSEYYVCRVTRADGTVPLAQSSKITDLLITVQNSPVATDLRDSGKWDHALFQRVLAKTPALDPTLKKDLEGYLRLAQAEGHENGLPRDQALAIVNECSEFLTRTSPTSKQAAWAFPLLANAYHALGRGDECLSTWAEYEKWHAAQEPCTQRTLLWAMYHHSEFPTDPGALDRWWGRYQEVFHLDSHNFKPTSIDMSVMANMVKGLLRQKRYGKVEHLTSQILSYLKASDVNAMPSPGGDILRGYRFDLSLDLAKALSALGRHREAADIYDIYFTWRSNQLYLKVSNTLNEEQIASLKDALYNETPTIIATLVQASRQDGLESKPDSKRDKRPPSSSSTQARTQPTMGDAVRAHLGRHYTKRLDELKEHLTDMTRAAIGFDDCGELTQAIERSNQEVEDLKKSLLKASAQPQGKKNASGSAKKKGKKSTKKVHTPNISDIGQRIDTFATSLKDLDRHFQKTQEVEQGLRKKELQAYLASLNNAQEASTPFMMENKPYEAPSVRQKEKTHGTAHPQQTHTPRSDQGATDNTRSQTMLFMKKKAEADYAALLPALQKKFHELATEIAQKPYQTRGGLGRPESLASSGGVYFSRRLSDGDRVVYEVIKKTPDSPIEVVFLSLLGHYESLARDKASTHIHPL
ncbi:MAG: hypothetical protein C0514_04065, partial [Candidatus Puniceispirillum sp.]|nr:hypothetical protein [Candidatus Puniceispirillum sp.]